MKPNPVTLSFVQSMWVAACVVLWILVAIVALLFVPNSTAISPALWLHLSATLLLLLLVKRMGGGLVNTFHLYSIQFKWLLWAISVAVIYWFIDHWVMDGLFKTNNPESIKSWQQANLQYHYLSVFISTVIMAPMFEELFFRGLIFRAILSRYNFILAALISALVFALIHWSWPEFISLFMAGLIYALLAYKSRSVLTPVIAHMLHNLMTYIYFTQ